MPGAGGFDAVFAIAIGAEGVDEVAKLWESWSDADGGQVSVMPLSIETAGLKSHNTLPS